MPVMFADVCGSEEINAYIRQADASLAVMGYTEHSFAHVTRCADLAAEWLAALGYSARERELARIAGYMHDLGNGINRNGHAQTGAVMAFYLLNKLGMDPAEIAVVVTAIGNHDEEAAHPANRIAAALILADKTDVRRSRVRNPDPGTFDIHDRVNYAVTRADTSLDAGQKTLTLDLDVNTDLCDVTDYFEIFLGRMLLCRRAAGFLELRFRLVINGSKLM